MFAPEVQEALKRPIDPRRVKSRQGGGGKTLSYISTEDAIQAANAVFGLGGWGYEVVELDYLGLENFERNGKKGYRVAYRATVKVTAHGTVGLPLATTFSDTGYGDAVEYGGSALTPHELASKEAVSDAVKRCLKNFGSQFGLDLYSEEGRADVARRAALLSGDEQALKLAVFGVAKEKLGVDKPTAAQVAKAVGLKTPGDLADAATLKRVLENEGLL
jgi:DNA recombination protein Rad52